MVSLTIAQDPAADRVLSEDPFGLLVGMLLDQQFPMERAFAGPANARSIGNCWSSSIPTRSAKGSSDSTRSAAGSWAIVSETMASG